MDMMGGMNESPSFKSQALELYYLMVEVPRLYDACVTGTLSLIGEQLLKATSSNFPGLNELQKQFNKYRPVSTREFTSERREEFLKITEELRDQFLTLTTTEEKKK